MRTVRVGQGWIPAILKEDQSHDDDDDDYEFKKSNTSSWKALLLVNSQLLAPAQRTECLQLKRWAETECKISDVCWRVRSGRARATVAPATQQRDPGHGREEDERRRMRTQRRQEQEGNGDDEGGGGIGWGGDRARSVARRETKSNKEKEKGRGPICKVAFDRGWEGWWIDDFLKWYREHLRLSS